MKLKETIIDNEYNDAFDCESEYTDWINCIEYEYTETGSSLTVTTKTNIVLHKDNKEEFSPYSTVNS